MLWTFADFLSASGIDVVETWYGEELSEEAQLLFDNILKDNQKTEDHRNWVGYRGFPKGEAKKYRIWEIGFKADDRQYRVFCIFGGNRKQVILLLGCYHKGRIYTPADAIDTAIRYVKALNNREATIHERPICIDF